MKIVEKIENQVMAVVYENSEYDYLVRIFGGIRDAMWVKDFMEKNNYQDVYGHYEYEDGEYYEFGFNKKN